MARLWALGEALIDFVPTPSKDGAAYLPRPGGSPANAAKAAALGGMDVVFAGDVSTDFFGDAIVADLAAHHVDVSHTPRSDFASTLAFVDLADGEARYAFFNEKSATSEMVPSADQFTIVSGDFVHVGSVSLVENPGADNIVRFVHDISDRAVISLDPNARPSVTKDPDSWRARIGRLTHKADLIKISDEDLNYLAPGTLAVNFAAELIGNGTSVVVVTRGADGAEAFARCGHIQLPGYPVQLADTVGAGDTITGYILADLAARGLNSKDALASIGTQQLEAVLDLALAAASITCSRIGCAPPTRAEAEAKRRPKS